MYVISKDFAFSASHQLAGLHEDHPCGRTHGHNYSVKVELTAADVDPTGFVLDYGALKPFAEYLDNTLDHRHLNDVLTFQPSAELLAEHLHLVLVSVLDLPAGVTAGVAVSETPKTWAWYRP